MPIGDRGASPYDPSGRRDAANWRDQLIVIRRLMAGSPAGARTSKARGGVNRGVPSEPEATLNV